MIRRGAVIRSQNEREWHVSGFGGEEEVGGRCEVYGYCWRTFYLGDYEPLKRAGTPFQRLQLNLKNAVLSRSPPGHWALSTST